LARLTPEKRLALLENPTHGDDQDPVQLVGTRDGRVIGRLDLFTGEAIVDGKPVPILWTSHLAVPEEFRKTLMGITLILKMHGLLHTVGACGVSVMAYPLFEKLKWRQFPMARHLAVRRSRFVIEKHVGAGWLGKLATVLADGALLGHRAILAGWSRVRTARLDCRPLPADDPEHDTRFDALLGALPERVRFHRSARWVKWIVNYNFDNDPRNRRAAFGIYARDGTLAAYFLIRFRYYETATHRGYRNVMLGSLMDWAIFDPQAVRLSQLILLAMRELARGGVDAIEICLPEEPGVPSLRRWGLLRVGVLHVMVKTGTGSPLASAEFANAANWRVRPAEGDNAFA
jgi:hypothetical protein